MTTKAKDDGSVEGTQTPSASLEIRLDQNRGWGSGNMKGKKTQNKQTVGIYVNERKNAESLGEHYELTFTL